MFEPFINSRHRSEVDRHVDDHLYLGFQCNLDRFWLPPLGHRDSFTPQALLYRFLRSQKQRNKGSGPGTTLCRAIVPSALVGLRDVSSWSPRAEIRQSIAGLLSDTESRQFTGLLCDFRVPSVCRISWKTGSQEKRIRGMHESHRAFYEQCDVQTRQQFLPLLRRSGSLVVFPPTASLPR